MSEKRDYDQEIARLVFERDSVTISNSFKGKLAILLHDHFCGYNHTDGCGWLYEVRGGLHDWNGSSHKPFFSQAERIISESAKLTELTENRVVDIK